MVCCKHHFYRDGKISPSNYPIKGYFDRTQLLQFLSSVYLYDDNLGHSSIPVYLWGKIIKRQFVRVGLLAGIGLRWGEDQIALFQILLNINSMYVLDDYLYYYVRYAEQTTSVYKSSLWNNQIKVYLRYKTIDKNKLLGTQLIKHVWKYSFVANIYKKMPQKLHSKDDFIEEFKKIDKIDGWKDFFKENRTGLGWKDDVKFWFMKLKLYGLFYRLFLRNHYGKTNQ